MSKRTRVISFIEDKQLIQKILKHLGLWDLNVRPTPKAKGPSVTISIDDSDSQVSFPGSSFYSDPDDPMVYNRISKPRWLTPMVMVSAMNILFPTPQKSEDLISIYSHGIHDSASNPQSKMLSLSDDLKASIPK